MPRRRTLSGVSDVNPDFVDEGRPQVIGFYGFRRKFCRIGNVTDLARQGCVSAVDGDRCSLAFVDFSQFIFRNIGADPFSLIQAERVDRRRRRGHVSRFDETRADDAVLRGDEGGLAQVILGGLQFVAQGLELCLGGVDIFLAIAVVGQVVGRLGMGPG